MNFKQIEMVGFKSFADPIKIVFENGITAIVGPNGCGKSNVADAIRWVLGEQSSKMLRGSSMQDVIFKGTEKRKSLSFCEVSLLFDNTNKIFKSDYDEICITRKLYRSGDSEYMINQTKCRLKDIIDLLYDSGIGKTGYSIIGQGKVDEIMYSKPADRRGIFEEAAGIAGFKAKKIDAERKLDRTQDNLTRINDIVSEIDRQLKPLKKQAETAKKYLELKEKLKVLEVNAYIYQYDYAATNKAEIETKINAIVEELNLRQGELDKVILNYNNTFEKVDSIDGDITHLRDEILRITVGIEKQEGQANVIKEKLKNLELDNKRLSEELFKLTENNETFETELHNKTFEIQKKNEKLNQLNQNIKEIQVLFDKVDFELKQSEDEANETQKKLFDTLSKLGDVKAQISALNAEKTTYIEQNGLLNNNLKYVENKIEESTNSYNESNNILQKLITQKDELQKICDTEIINQNKLNVEYKSLEEQLNSLNSNLISLEHRKKMLEDMQKEYEGFSGSVKRLLLDAEKNDKLKNNIIGVLASLIKVPEKYQSAIEMALGNAVQNIVTKTDNGAKELINYLKQKEYGRVTFLPVNVIKGRYFDNSLSDFMHQDGVFGIASELIEYNNNINNIISHLLGTTVVVNNIDTAVNFARQTKYVFKIVTLDGDVINPQGSMTGGSKKSQVANVLARKTEIENSIKIIDKLNNEKYILSNNFEKLSNQLNNLNQELKLNTNNLHNVEISLATERERYNKFNQICLNLENEKNSIMNNISKNSQIIESINNELEKIDSSNNIDSQNTKNFEQNTNQFSKMRAVRDDYASQITNLKVEIASISTEILNTESDIERIKFAIENNNNISCDLANKIQFNQDEINKLNLQIQSNVEKIDSQTDFSELEKVKINLNQLSNLKNNLQSNLRKLEEERMRLGTEVSKLQDKKHQQEINLSKIDTDIETMQERVWAEYELTYNTALQYKVDEFDLKPSLIEISNLKREINKLGAVNVNAIEDSKLLEERYGNLYEQAQDLMKAEEDLQKIISDLSDEMTARFEDSFNTINENFKEAFKELFGGGTAHLKLVDSDDMLEAGVDIVAEPPGKHLSNITLLSGGEKALTAIAILFGILRAKPMPFCLLDEIEAALDEANVARVAQYLQKYSNETQFIVITHKKPTMERADALYGVTMEEKGVSKIVSVKLTDAIKNIED